MANFWDLPRTVRDQIYRLHLLRDDGISKTTHDKIATHVVQHRRGGGRRVPPICALSTRADKEAAPIYYGENRFEFRGPVMLCSSIWTK